VSEEGKRGEGAGGERYPLHHLQLRDRRREDECETELIAERRARPAVAQLVEERDGLRVAAGREVEEEGKALLAREVRVAAALEHAEAGVLVLAEQSGELARAGDDSLLDVPAGGDGLVLERDVVGAVFADGHAGVARARVVGERDGPRLDLERRRLLLLQPVRTGGRPLARRYDAQPHV